MNFDENTKLIDILNAYPWLSERLPQIDKRMAVMNTPMGKMMMKKNSVADLSKLSGYSAEKLLNRLKAEIEAHEKEA